MSMIFAEHYLAREMYDKCALAASSRTRECNQVVFSFVASNAFQSFRLATLHLLHDGFFFIGPCGVIEELVPDMSFLFYPLGSNTILLTKNGKKKSLGLLF